MPAVLEGHRARMRKRFAIETPEMMREQDLVEFLLYYVIRRGDTKDRAADLLDKFGSLYSILHAEETELTTIKGVGSVTAKWLISLGRLLDAYVELKPYDRPVLGNLSHTLAYFMKLFEDRKLPIMWQCCLSEKGKLLSGSVITENIFWYEPESLKKALVASIMSEADSVILGQYLPYDKRKFDYNDVLYAQKYALSLMTSRTTLLDFLIITPFSTISMFADNKLNKEIRKFRESNLMENYLLTEDTIDNGY